MTKPYIYDILLPKKVGDQMYQNLGDTGIVLYGALNGFSRVLAFIFTVFILGYKQKSLGRGTEFFLNGISKGKKKPKFAWFIFLVVESLIITFAQFYLGGLNTVFGDLVGTGANYFGTLFVSPIMVALFGLLLGWDIFKLMDIITVVYPFRLIFVKLACFCQGCCRGFICSYGLYNYSTNQREFPVQLVELGFAATIFVFLLFWRKKAKEGTMFPIYLIIYCATRFFSEFLRVEENVFLIFKKYHILCLIGIVVGVFLLFVIEKYKERIRRFYGDYFDAVEDTLNDVAVRMGLKRKNDIVHNKNKKKRRNIPVQTADKKARIATMKKWIIIWTLGLIGQIGWNVAGTWFNTFVYEKVDKSPAVLTPMLIASAFATTISIFLFGTLTDRTGNRRTLVSSGFVVWGILIACFGLTQFIVNHNFAFAIAYMVIMNMLLNFFGSIGTGVGYNTWLTDIMNDSNRGQIGGAIAIQSVLGALLGNIIGGYIIGSENNYLRLFIIMGSLLSAFGMVSVFLFDKKDDVKPIITGRFSKQLASVFNFRTLLNNKELLLVHIAVAIYFIGYRTYFPHLGNVLIDYWGYSASQTGIIQAIPMLFAMIVTMPISKFINKSKFLEVSLVSVIVGLAGNLSVFAIAPEDIDSSKTFNFRIFMGVFLVGVSYIIMLQTTKTWTKNLCPNEAKGQYEGFWAVAFSLIPTIFGSNIGELIIKNSGEGVLNAATQRYEYIPDGKVFLVGGIISALSIIPIVIAKITLNKKSLKEKQL